MNKHHQSGFARTNLTPFSLAIAATWSCLATFAQPLVTTNSATADDEFSALAAMPLDEVMKIEVTTATQTAVSIAKAPSTIYSFSAEDIRQRGVHNLLQLVNFHVPGAFVTEDGDELIAAFRGVAVVMLTETTAATPITMLSTVRIVRPGRRHIDRQLNFCRLIAIASRCACE